MNDDRYDEGHADGLAWMARVTEADIEQVRESNLTSGADWDAKTGGIFTALCDVVSERTGQTVVSVRFNDHDWWTAGFVDALIGTHRE